MAETTIEWTDKVWNPLRGCSRVSEGCQHCYAETMAGRFSGPGMPFDGLTRPTIHGRRWTGEVRLLPEKLNEPLGWKKPSRIFVNSMSDLFHESVPNDFILRVWHTMSTTPRHTYQILTKRPERMMRVLNEFSEGRWMIERVSLGRDLPLPNVWLGVSVENQAAADERIPLLLETPAAVRWISAEPLLGPLDLREYLGCGHRIGETGGDIVCSICLEARVRDEPWLDWIVAGGESGPGARPMRPDWARSVHDQCQRASVPFFFKQWGAWTPNSLCDEKEELMHRVGKKPAGAVLDGREWKEYPAK